MLTDSEHNAQISPLLVAVYGTLKRGQCNHHVMLGSQYVGSDCLNVITLYDLGPYPAAKVEASEGIEIEVFSVTPAHLAVLDMLEEYNPDAPDQGMYNRVPIETCYGAAWIYIYNEAVHELAAQRRGAWLPGQAQVLQDSGRELKSKSELHKLEDRNND